MILLVVALLTSCAAGGQDVAGGAADGEAESDAPGTEPSGRLVGEGAAEVSEEPGGAMTVSAVTGSEQRLAGVCRTGYMDESRDEWGVGLTARDISATGLTIECVWSRDTDAVLTISDEYFIQALTDGEWLDVERISAGSDNATVQWDIPTGYGSEEWSVDWTETYGELPRGTYRVGKAVRLEAEDGSGDERLYYARFDLADADELETLESGYGGVTVSVPYVDGWEYIVYERSVPGDGSDVYGVGFRPVGRDGWVELLYNDGFAVCGMGLEEVDVTIGGADARQGFFDGSSVWSFIRFTDPYAEFVALNDGADQWLEQYNDQVMSILSAGLSAISGSA